MSTPRTPRQANQRQRQKALSNSYNSLQIVLIAYLPFSHWTRYLCFSFRILLYLNLMSFIKDLGVIRKVGFEKINPIPTSNPILHSLPTNIISFSSNTIKSLPSSILHHETSSAPLTQPSPTTLVLSILEISLLLSSWTLINHTFFPSIHIYLLYLPIVL